METTTQKELSDYSTPTPRDYQKALDSQSACNLFALVNSLVEVLPRIKNQSGGLSEKLNQHPIVVLYVEQLYHLSGSSQQYINAHTLCTKRAKEQT